MAHLACIGHTRDEINDLLSRYAAAGISNILALRGDTPKSPGSAASTDFGYAVDLVRAIGEFNRRGVHQHPRGFGVAVAGYPEGHPGTPNRIRELENLKAKVDAGADCIITQLFYDNRDFYDFRERCKLCGITVPIVAGIMPITSIAGLN